MNYALSTEPIRRESIRRISFAFDGEASANADVDNDNNAAQQRKVPTNISEAAVPDIELDRYPATSSTVPAARSDGRGTKVSRMFARRRNQSGSQLDGRAGGRMKEWRVEMSRVARRAWSMLMKYATFIGPGFMVAVAYIDPGKPSPYTQVSISPR